MKQARFVIFTIAIFFSSCEKETIVMETELVEKTYSWIKHPFFKDFYAKTHLSYATDDKLFIKGGNMYNREFEIDTENNAKSLFSNVNTSNHFLPLSRVNVTAINGLIRLRNLSTTDGTNINSTVFLQLENYDPNFIEIVNQNTYVDSPIGAFNDSNQLLIPYKAETNYDSFALITFSINDNAGNYEQNIFLEQVQIIKIPNFELGSRNEYYCYSINNYFIVSRLNNNPSNYRINSNGTYHQFNNHTVFNNLVKIENKLYGLNGSGIFISHDDGQTWANYSALLAFWYTLYNVDNRLILVTNSNLFEIIFNDTGFIGKELNNDAFDGINVTSIVEFNNKIYVTTHSGVYYKEKFDFFDYKQN